MTRTLVSLTTALLLTMPVALATAQTVDFTTLDGKVLLGYQGWFN